MTKQEVLSSTSFGKRVAEEEGNELSSYFVETDQWKGVFSGEVDIIYGSKGAGKSAIYSLILRREDQLLARSITVIPAENTRGSPAFNDLVADPPASENECRGLWKIYFLSLIGQTLKKFDKLSDEGKHVINALEEAKLLSREHSLSGILKSALDYVRRVMKAEALEGGIKINPVTGQPEGLTGRIILRQPDTREHEAGFISADELLKLCQTALTFSNRYVWLILDRLDVAFADSLDLESNVLRSLFRVYLDLLPLNRMPLKIFLRSDIWQRIMARPFPEASHITRAINLSWDKNSLLNLVVRRLLHNRAIVDKYKANPQEVLGDLAQQLQLFYLVFPAQVDAGPNKPRTLDWMLTRTSDGTKKTAPRELIHLLSSAKDVQMRAFEIGTANPPGEALFDRGAIKAALPEVSRARFQQTLCAEYPQYKEVLEKLEKGKTEPSPRTLARIWNVSEDEAHKLAEKLSEVGFFERQGTTDQPVYWVPFLYRGALSMVQGAAR
jgi:hypothetical protein